MKTSEIAKLFNCSMISKNKAGNYVARWSYFYMNGNSAEKYAAVVQRAIPSAKIINTGNKWVPFKGGHSVAQGSHFWVEFQV